MTQIVDLLSHRRPGWTLATDRLKTVHLARRVWGMYGPECIRQMLTPRVHRSDCVWRMLTLGVHPSGVVCQRIVFSMFPPMPSAF